MMGAGRDLLLSAKKNRYRSTEDAISEKTNESVFTPKATATVVKAKDQQKKVFGAAPPEHGGVIDPTSIRPTVQNHVKLTSKATGNKGKIGQARTEALPSPRRSPD